MTLRTAQHQSPSIATISTAIATHLQFQLKGIGCRLDVDCFVNLSFFYFDGLVALVLWLKVSRLEVMEQLAKLVSLLGGLLEQMLSLDG